MDTDALLTLGLSALAALESYADALVAQDQLPLTQNRKFVAVNDDLSLMLNKAAMGHQHLVERSQTESNGKLTLPR